MSYKEIRITVKPDDYERIKNAAHAKNLSMSAFIRSLADVTIDDVRNRGTIDCEQLVELIYHLKKIGGNINQIAKKLNYGDDVSSRFLLQQLLIIQKTLKEAMHDCQN
ncbi:MAG: plasmid mobilization relaxosome protein MobC [Sulfuricurvum sp.]|nr:plasmid mobilization relaxosome protein MobC [Sulfuricurvum sp.]